MTSSPSSSASVSLRPWVSTTPTTTSYAVLLAGARLLQHLVGLADAGRGADEDLQPAGARSPRAGASSRASGEGRWSDRAADPPSVITALPSAFDRPSCAICARPRASSARLSASTLTRGSPRRPRKRPSMLLVDELTHASSGRLRALATRGTWKSAASGEMCGSRPLAEVVTRSIGTGADGFSCLQLVDVGLDAVDQRLVGRAEVRAAGVGGVVGRGTVLVESFGSGADRRRRPAVEIAVAR